MQDTPTQRTSLDELSIEQFDSWLEEIRKARLIVKRVRDASNLLTNEVRQEQIRKKWDQNLKMLNKEMTSMDNLIEKLEKRINVLRGLSLESGIYVEPVNIKVISIKGVDGNDLKKPANSE